MASSQYRDSGDTRTFSRCTGVGEGYLNFEVLFLGFRAEAEAYPTECPGDSKREECVYLVLEVKICSETMQGTRIKTSLVS